MKQQASAGPHAAALQQLDERTKEVEDAVQKYSEFLQGATGSALRPLFYGVAEGLRKAASDARSHHQRVNDFFALLTRHRKDAASNTDGYFDVLGDPTCKAIFGYLEAKDVSSVLQLNKSFYNKWKSLLLGASVGHFGKKRGSKMVGTPTGSPTVAAIPPSAQTDALAEWLAALSLPQEYHLLLYKDGFDDMDTLSLITEQDLKNIGITKIGHIRRMLYALREFRQSQRNLTAQPQPTSPPQETPKPASPMVIMPQVAAATAPKSVTTGHDAAKKPQQPPQTQPHSHHATNPAEKKLLFDVGGNGEKPAGAHEEPSSSRAGKHDKKEKEKEKKSKKKKKKEKKENQKQARGVTFQGSSSNAATGNEEESTIVLVDFSRKQLSEVPDEVWTRTDATILNMYMNKLDSLPAEVGKLKNLTMLGLNENNISSLPPEISSLQKLKILDLRYNKLVSIPPEIKHLTQLNKLFLRFNRLAVLPEELGGLRNLEILSVRNNQLVSLPNSLDMLCNLKVLDGSTNKLQQIRAVDKLVLLKELDLKLNQLSTLPSGWKSLEQLTRVDLSHNQFSQFPDALAEAPNLQSLDMEGNQLSSLGELPRLSSLESLYLNRNRLHDLPSSISLLKNLTILQVKGNKLSELPEAFQTLGKLKELDLSTNSFSVFPQAVLLGSLQTLILSDNSVRELPSNIAMLSSLKCLNMEGNQLETIHRKISRLSNLAQLRLGYNEIRTIPEEIGTLPNLKELDLEHNQLQSLPATIGSLPSLSLLILNDNELNDLPNELVLLDNLSELKIDSNPMKNIPDADKGGNAVFHYLLKRAAKGAKKQKTKKKG